MSWSYVALTNGSNYGTFTPSSWPSGVQEGDIVIFAGMIAPDSSASYEYTCTTSNWTKQTSYGGQWRFMWARYSAAISLPTLTQGTGVTTAYWRLVAFRPTNQSAFAFQKGVDGSPPAASTYTTTANSTLLCLFASVPGDQGAGWTPPSSFTALVNLDGNGTADPDYPNIWLGYRVVSSANTTISDLRAYIVSNRYYVFGFAEDSNNLGLPFFI